jgi:hypothetical protein
MKIPELKLYHSILLLVPLGWFLNGKYYFSRFQSEGFDFPLSIVIAVTLIIFASFVFGCSQYFREKKSRLWVLFFSVYIILAIYSINCTTAGQYWDQQKINQQSDTVIIDKENTAFLISLYKEKINDLKNEYKKLNTIRDNSLSDLSDLYYYKNTTKTIEDMKTEIKTELKDYETKLENLLKKNKVSAKNQDDIKMSKTLYIFYNENSPEKVQFIFQVILSIIIESIAQLSIFSIIKIEFFNTKKNEIKEIKNIYTPVKITKNELRHFCVIAWGGIEKKQSKSLAGKTAFMNIASKVCHSFTEEKHSILMRKALENDLIRKENNEYFPNFIDRDNFYHNMCEIMNFT